jgi:hypothetical protein
MEEKFNAEMAKIFGKEGDYINDVNLKLEMANKVGIWRFRFTEWATAYQVMKELSNPIPNYPEGRPPGDGIMIVGENFEPEIIKRV